MFAEENIYGVKNINVDSNGRFVLPAFTGASKDEILLIEKDEDSFRIYNEEYVDCIINSLEKENYSFDEFKNYNKELEEYLFSHIIKSVKVDGQGRINGGDTFNKYNVLKVIGCRNYVKIEVVK